MSTALVTRAQNKIKKMLAQGGLNVKDIANETHIPYSTIRDALNVTGRLSIPWLSWYADHFGATTDYLLSRDNPDNNIAENFKLAREHAGVTLKDAHGRLDTTEYALNDIENGDMEAPFHFLQKAVMEYQVPSDFILGVTEQSSDTEIITTLFRDIRFLLICQDIHRRQELRRLFSMLRGLSDNELGRLTKVIEHLVNEWISVSPEKTVLPHP
jgi:transcriptional regulator with XRE-family HTH domain